MRKKITVLLIVFTLFFALSCVLGGCVIIYGGGYEAKATKKLKKIIRSINNNDKEALRGMFSQRALAEADDFDENLDRLFEFFPGKIDSWEYNNGPSVTQSNDYGSRIRQVNSYVNITSGKQKFFFFIKDFHIDTDNPDNVGLYMFLAVKAEDKHKIWDGDYKMLRDGDKRIERIGIYIPCD